MKLLHCPNKVRLSFQELFYLEQWTALLIGIVCLGVSAWAGLSGFRESATVYQSGFRESALDTMKCSLTVAVALIGIALVRFAFYKPGRKKPSAPIDMKKRSTEEGTRNSSAGSTLAKSEAIHQGRG